MQPSEARREKIAEVINSPARKPPGLEGRACSPENLHAVARFPPDWHPASGTRFTGPTIRQRRPSHHCNLAPKVTNEILRELGQELAGGSKIRIVRAVEEA